MEAWLSEYLRDACAQDRVLIVALMKSLFGIHFGLLQVDHVPVPDYAPDWRSSLTKNTQIKITVEAIRIEACIERRLIRHSRYFSRYFRFGIAEGVIKNEEWVQLVADLNGSSGDSAARLFWRYLEDRRKTDTSGTWLYEMPTFALPRLDPAAALTVSRAIVRMWPELSTEPDRNGNREGTSAERLLEEAITACVGLWSKQQVLSLFEESVTITLLPRLLQAYQIGLFQPGISPTPEQQEAFEKAKEICRAQVTQYAAGTPELFDDPHLRATLAALFEFHSEPERVVYRALDRRPDGLLRLLGLYLAGGGLQYKQLRERYTPRKLLEYSALLSVKDKQEEDAAWLLKALDRGVTCDEAYSFIADYVDDTLGYFEGHRFVGNGRIYTPHEALVDRLHELRHGELLNFGMLAQQYRLDSLPELLTRLEESSNLGEDDRKLLAAVRAGLECHARNDIVPAYVRYDGQQYICQKDDGTIIGTKDDTGSDGESST